MNPYKDIKKRLLLWKIRKIKIVEEKISKVQKLAEEIAYTASNGNDLATENELIIYNLYIIYKSKF